PRVLSGVAACPDQPSYVRTLRRHHHRHGGGRRHAPEPPCSKRQENPGVGARPFSASREGQLVLSWFVQVLLVRNDVQKGRRGDSSGLLLLCRRQHKGLWRGALSPSRTRF